jgi:Protein of unknown function (DUF3011)
MFKVAKFGLLLIAISFFQVTPALAYYDEDEVDVIDEVVCESIKGRTAYCQMDTRGEVVLVEQLSRSECSEGYSWGVDRRGLWVSQGCRGSFATVVPRPRPGRRQGGYVPTPPPVTDGIVRCESYDQQQAYCALPFRGRVRLVNQLSRAQCREGFSWGYDRRGIWVSRGCRAEFEVY